MTDPLFVPTNPLEIVGWTPSNANTLHAITADNNFRCGQNTKIGMVFMVDPNEWNNVKCGNCLRLIRYDGK